MYAYKLCQVDYALKDSNAEIMRGSGSLWLSPDSIFIKTDERWYYLPGSNILNMAIINNMMIIGLKNKIKVELKSKNIYILRALYHYLEGGVWRRA